MKFIISAMVAIALMTGCTANERAKSFGGKLTINLPCNQKLFDLTWKETNLWYAYRPMRDWESATAETYTFKEDSSWGMMEGEVTFVESKCNR